MASIRFYCLADICIFSLSLSLDLFLIPSLSLLIFTARVYIEPIENIDISGNNIGTNISIGCHIQTCEPELTVTILKDRVIIQESEDFSGQNNVLVNADLMVSESTVGMYECSVRLSDGEVFNQRFNITGVCADPRDPSLCLL